MTTPTVPGSMLISTAPKAILDNARYWYRTAGKRAATGALDTKRAAIIKALTDT